MEKDSNQYTSEASVKDLHQRIENELLGSFEAQCEEVFDQRKELEPSVHEARWAEVIAVRDCLLGDLQALDTPDELRQGVAAQYVKLTSQWALLLAQMQSQLKQKDRVEEGLVYQASCMSLLLQRLEPLLDWKEVEAVAQMLAAPLSFRPSEQ